MRFSPALLDEIRARLPVSEIVGRRVRLHKAGREWKGLSPFNAERTPSFFVNDQKGFYHDFSSGKHGDIFAFVMETEGLGFAEAVEKLAGLAGVELPKLPREALRLDEERRGLAETMALAAAHFQTELKGRRGAAARAYLEGRGLGSAVQERFGIGYATAERHGLRDHLAGKGVTVETMIEAGLLVHGEDIAVPYDRFRDRIMFPICDARGRVIAFGGRALAADVPAKYLNSPETPLFHKGQVLYNLHNARKAAHEAGTVIAVEGYVDVIAMSVAGFAHTVAPLGTALTQDQLGLLWRMASEPVLCFDGDKAGRRAAYRAIDTALPLLEVGRSLRFALLPEGQDPDDLARGGGAGAIRAVLDAAMPLADLIWSREVEAGPLDTPERRAALEKRLFEMLAGIKDESLRRHYREDMQRRLREQFRPAPQPGPRGGGRGGGGRPGRDFGERRPINGAREPLALSESLRRSAIFARAAAVPPREALILALFVAHPHLLSAHAEELAALDFVHSDTRRLKRVVVDFWAHDPTGEATGLRASIEASREAPVLARIEAMVGVGDRACLAAEASRLEIAEILKQAMTLHRRALTLHNELKAAEQALGEDGSDANLAWIRDVRSQLQALEGTEADPEGLRRVTPGGGR
jgi:DNA primase